MLFEFLGRLVNIREEIIQSLVNPDVDINGYVDWFHLNRGHLHLAPGLYLMLGAAQTYQKKQQGYSTE